MNKSKYQSLFT